MSLLYAENLLRQYNKNANAINTSADDTSRGGQRFFTESYLNKYDSLYNKFKDNKNFNAQMWHQAFKNGDQDAYLAFLEQSKDKDMSPQFYDPMYYDYESMMLELYKPFASATELDKNTAKTVKELQLENDITNDQAYIQYQLDQIHNARNEEIELSLEQERKDQLGWWGQFGSDIAAGFAEFGEGILTGLAGVVDLIASPFYATASAIGGEDWLDSFVDYFGSKGLTALEKQSVRAALDEYERTHTHFMDINGNVTGVGKYVAGITNSIGMMVPAIVTNYFTGGAASLAWVGPTTFYASIFSGNVHDNAVNRETVDSPSWLKVANASVKTGIEVLVEWCLGKVLGGTIQNAAIGMTGGKIGSGLMKGMAKGAGLKYLFKSAGQEGLEEFLQDFSTNLADQFAAMKYEGYGKTGVTFQTLVDSFFIGALSSLVMSGGRIAASGIGTSIKNKSIEKKTGQKDAADMYVEVDGKPKKLHGANKLYYSSIISQFNNAVEKLNDSKITNKKTLALAKEVYGAFEIMSQFYSSFSKERIENAERLLNRVTKAEQNEIDAFRAQYDTAGKSLTDETVSDIILQDKQTDRLHTFASTITNEFRSMIGDTKLRLSDVKRVDQAAKAVSEELTEAGVTTTTGMIDVDGSRHKIDPELKTLVDELDDEQVKPVNENIENKLKELHGDYDIIFTTDGHIAVEEDGILFVSEAWLENYDTSEIYQFLAQNRILNTITQDKELKPLVDTLIAFDKEFTKQENVTAERAVMDLLFNKSVYQAFLLSHKGKNLLRFKNFVFRLQDLVKLLGEDKINSDKRTSTETKTKRKAYLNQVYEQIKDTMRIPTIKAILNWNMNPQLIGADSILTQADREFINQYQARKRLASKEGKSARVSSAYEHIAENIVRGSRFTKDEKVLIERGLADNADEKSRLIALALLNAADSYIDVENKTRPDFIMPVEAFAGTEESAMAVQYKADKLDEFEKTYHVSAEQLIRGDLVGMGIEQVKQMEQDMYVLGADNYVSFVQYKLETMLGNDYTVVPKFDINAEQVRECTGFNIVRSIPADELLIPELLTDKGTDAFNDMFDGNEASVNDFLKVKTLSDWKVLRYYDAENKTAGLTNNDEKFIAINMAVSNSPVDTLVHEINHAIQYTYELPGGLSIESSNKTTGFLRYVVENYKEVVNYTLRRENLNPIDDTAEMLKSDRYRSVVARVAYGLIQGELWAEHYEHNGKLVKGFEVVADKTGKTFIVSPDGKTVFEMPFSDHAEQTAVLTKKTQSEMILPDHYIQNSIAREFDTIYRARESLYENGYMHNGNIRNTYHNSLSSKSGMEVVQSLVNKNLPLMTRLCTTIDNIILAPETYLNDELLDQLGDDTSEGHTFYFLKNYVEKQYESVSIDRTANTHDYILVDDNAFDDLLRPKMLEYADDENGTYIAENMEGINLLSDFYDTAKLIQLKLNGNIKVEISPDTKSYTDFSRYNASGVIHIRSTTKGRMRTDSEIIDTLNHEFRHIMQGYNNLETGFTPDFIVTPSMLKDLKAKVPEIFDNTDIRILAKRAGVKNVDAFIAQRFIYYLVGGEKNAYGIKASLLNTKPIYVTDEAGKYTIFMPWYNANTGEGRYVTKQTSKSAEDDEEFADEKRVRTPYVNRKPKYKEVVTKELSDEERLVKYIYEGRRREVLARDSKNNNLQYFKKKGERTQLDVDLYDFILATTGNENKLPPAIVNAIKKGVLTKQSLYKWFRQVDTKKINQYTFDLINKYMFKNEYITDMSELERITTLDPSFYWAASIVLAKEGVSFETLLKENDVDKLLAFLNSLEGTKWKEKIEKLQLKFDWYKTDKGVENYILDEKISNYMRVFTMQWFDGTLAGAFYTAKAFRKTIRAYEAERSGDLSLDAEKNNGKGDKSTTLGDTISNEDGELDGNTRQVANDIEALYNISTNIAVDEMVGELVRLKYLDEVNTLVSGLNVSPQAKNKISGWLKERDTLMKNTKKLTEKENRTEAENKLLRQLNFVVNKLKTIMQNMASYQYTLDEMTEDEIAARYAEIVNAEMVNGSVPADVIDTKTNRYKNTRINIASRIKRTSTALLNLVRDGKLAFADLPKEVQNMFELKTYKVEGKNVQRYELKPDVYSVGRGPAEIAGKAEGRMLYSGKRNLADASQTQKHDVSKILKNDELLRLTLSVARQEIKQKKSGIDKGIKQVKQLQKKLNAKIENKKVNQQKTETHFRVTAKRRTNDTPNNFVVNSDVSMPDMLRKILDTSFEDMANTEVQFASRDEDGTLYDKAKFDKKQFDSRLKHEVNNWEAFYEANRTQLLALTREDVLDIVDFMQRSNMTSLDGPTNKLAAFEIFLLGYIVDATRRNFNNWDFSDQQVEMIEKLYEKKASAYGSGLNAVRQMLTVVDPFKRVAQRSLDDYNINEADQAKLFKAVSALQGATNVDTRRQRAADLARELDRIEGLMIEGDTREKGFGKRWYQKLKSARYSFMLSSPITWIRNIISNVVVENLNKASDVIGNFFVKKGYRKNQWDLSKVQVSENVKNFIDENIKDNKLFSDLYENTTKYDDMNKKNIDAQRELFYNMIVRALEHKYAAEHRFDSKTANALAGFITKMISDKRFIKHATEKYFSKMLTIEVARGNVSLDNGLSNRVLNLFAEAVIMSNNDYMHKRSFLADSISKLRDTSPVAYEVLTFWQPFLNSSLNWFNELLKYSPIGLITSIVNLSKLEKTITKVEEKRAKGETVPDSRVVEYLTRRDVGKGAIGLTFTILGILLGSFGVIRIKEDDDKLYIYAGDVKIDITNIFGTSSILVGASIAQSWVQSDTDVRFDEVMRMVTAQLFEGFILNDLLARHKWDDGFWDFMLTESESVLRSFVPQFVQLLIRATNNERIRYTPGFVGMWERWLNTFVPTQPFGSRKINPYTGEVETKYAIPVFGEFLKSGLLGPKIFWSEVTDEELLAKDYGVNKGELTGKLTVNGKTYSLDKEAVNEKYGQLNKETLAQLKSQKHYVEMPNGKYKTLSWDKMSEAQRANVIDREMNKNADIARIFVWTQQMNKRFYASEAMWQTLRRLGITKNVFRGDKGFAE